jgi:23S rRNA pseudouridine955/2504/2580 synthase
MWVLMNISSVQKVIITKDEEGTRLERWLKRKFPQENYNHLQKLIRTGQIRVNGKRAKGPDKLIEGQEVRLPPFHLSAQQASRAPLINMQAVEELQAAIIYEDTHILVLNKPTNLPVQGGTNTKTSLDQLIKYLPFSYAKNLRLTHRLDKDTSGVLILAKTASDAAWVTGQFKQNKVEKIYWALVVGQFQETTGVIDLPLAKLPTPSGEKIKVDLSKGLKASTHYRVRGYEKGISWIEFYPQTGRTHQIRVHSAALGCPVLGDGKYGGKAAHPLPKRLRIQLHAYCAGLVLPSGEKHTFTALLPHDMERIFEDLGFSLKKSAE